MLIRLINKTKRINNKMKVSFAVRKKVKYFCIGQNKTGTTSLRKAFEDLGYTVGDQPLAERIADQDYFRNKFDRIIRYCKSAQVFQDVPFSWPNTYKYLDVAYPNSKFILTIRDDSEQWYRSITKFHAKLFGNNTIPNANDLQIANYVSKGFMYKAVKLYGAPNDDMYNKNVLTAMYNKYNEAVISYFGNRSNDLLVINLSDKDAYGDFIRFLGVQSPYSNFPWENKT